MLNRWSTLTAGSGSEWQHVLATIAYEGFDYAAGAGGLNGQTGGTGWATAWSNVGNNMDVVATSLADPTSTLPTSGGAAQVSTAQVSLAYFRRVLEILLVVAVAIESGAAAVAGVRAVDESAA